MSDFLPRLTSCDFHPRFLRFSPAIFSSASLPRFSLRYLPRFPQAIFSSASFLRFSPAHPSCDSSFHSSRGSLKRFPTALYFLRFPSATSSNTSFLRFPPAISSRDFLPRFPPANPPHNFSPALPSCYVLKPFLPAISSRDFLPCFTQHFPPLLIYSSVSLFQSL